jgi:hypothetical protein
LAEGFGPAAEVRDPVSYRPGSEAIMEKALSSQARDWREGRRLRAFELKERGWKQMEIADALGVSAP